MLMIKTKFAKLIMGVMVVSVMSLGAVSTVNACETQPNLDNKTIGTTQEQTQKESYTNYHAAAQFTYNEDGDKILKVTPKSDIRHNHANRNNDIAKTPVVDEETPAVVDETTPVVDEVTPAAIDDATPVVVVDETTPLVDEVTPAAIDDATPVEITKISIYDKLVNTYTKLLNLYETLLNNFESGTTPVTPAI